MSDDVTTPAAGSGDAGTNYQAKYDGLMRVHTKRIEELSTAHQAIEQHKSSNAELVAELETYRTRDRAAQEEAALETQYESLKTRFEPDSPTPRGTNGVREPRQETGDEAFNYAPSSKGFPV